MKEERPASETTPHRETKRRPRIGRIVARRRPHIGAIRSPEEREKRLAESERGVR